MEDALQRARRYDYEGLAHHAWSLSDVDAAIDTICDAGLAIAEIAIAVSHDGSLTEALPLDDGSAWGLRERVRRRLEDAWLGLVERSRVETQRLQADLLDSLESEPRLNLRDKDEVLFRLTWYDEVAWRKNYGQNLLQLIEGEVHEPEIARDVRNVAYSFRDHGGTEESGRALFDLAERVCAAYSEIETEILTFLLQARTELLPEDDDAARIVAFTFLADESEQRVSVYLYQADPNPEDTLYGFWEVELDPLRPVRYAGVVPALPW